MGLWILAFLFLAHPNGYRAALAEPEEPSPEQIARDAAQDLRATADAMSYLSPVIALSAQVNAAIAQLASEKSECKELLKGKYLSREAGEWLSDQNKYPVTYRDPKSKDESFKSAQAGEIQKGPFNPNWDQYIRDEVMSGKYNQTLMNASAAKMKGICSGFPRLTPEQKSQLWAAWFEALARIESGLRPKLSMKEKFKADDGSPQVSAGLLSMSLDDRKKGCRFSNWEQVVDPIRNLECGLITMQVLWKSRSTALDVARRYWGPTRKTRENYPEFRGYLAKALKFRQLDQACPDGMQAN